MGVAKIEDTDLPVDALPELLSELKRQNVKLVYWFASREHAESALCSGGLLNSRVIYTIDLRTTLHTDLSDLSQIESYSSVVPNEALEALAIQSGRYSRFNLDPAFPQEKFEAMYRKWIQRSVSREIADTVLVIRQQGREVAMVTLGKAAGTGSVGLIAVDRAFRGRGYGSLLMQAARHWFIAQGFERVNIITQGKNKESRSLFERCGYRVDRMEFVHHFWL
ncbi:MAG: GNAT family N-acetyltransferase [Proteobacteria bacterium]|nr:GNAT family N-acetyltransferase [Pseudomonadota bacterium]HQR03433.1 GNAT family N-acetyltransferase [Rhodocyclaceae bacterium]